MCANVIVHMYTILKTNHFDFKKCCEDQFTDYILGVFTCKAPCGRGYTRHYWWGDCEYTGDVATTAPYETPAPEVATGETDCIGSLGCCCCDFYMSL